PTPVAKAVQSLFGAKLKPGESRSLKGEPKKPQTTGNVAPATGPAWMCAAVRSSLGTPGVWLPVKSMLNTVTEKLRAVPVSSRINVAVPNDSGLEAPSPAPGPVVGGPRVGSANELGPASAEVVRSA